LIYTKELVKRYNFINVFLPLRIGEKVQLYINWTYAKNRKDGTASLLFAYPLINFPLHLHLFPNTLHKWIQTSVSVKQYPKWSVINIWVKTWVLCIILGLHWVSSRGLRRRRTKQEEQRKLSFFLQKDKKYPFWGSIW